MSQAYHLKNTGEDQQDDGDQYGQFDEDGEDNHQERRTQEMQTKPLLSSQLIEDVDLSQYQSKPVNRVQRARESEDFEERHEAGGLKGGLDAQEGLEKSLSKEGEDSEGKEERKRSGPMDIGLSGDAGDDKGYRMELRLVNSKQPVQIALLWIDLDSEIEFKRETIQFDAERSAYTTQVTFKELITHPSVRFELRLNGEEFKGKPV